MNDSTTRECDNGFRAFLCVGGWTLRMSLPQRVGVPLVGFQEKVNATEGVRG